MNKCQKGRDCHYYHITSNYKDRRYIIKNIFLIIRKFPKIQKFQKSKYFKIFPLSIFTDNKYFQIY